MILSPDLHARLLSQTTNKVTNWPTETWVIHEANDPGKSVQQVTLFRDQGAWYAWTGNIIRNAQRELAKALAALRNEVES